MFEYGMTLKVSKSVNLCAKSAIILWQHFDFSVFVHKCFKLLLLSH